MKMRNVLAAGIVLATAALAARASTVHLSIQLTPNSDNTGGTYQIFETITNSNVPAATSINESNGTPTSIPSGQSLGIYDTDVLVSSGAGVMLLSGQNSLPKVNGGLRLDDAGDTANAGFSILPHATAGTDSSGHKTFDIGAAQDLSVQYYTGTNPARKGQTDILTGFGLPGHSSGLGGDITVSFGDPALIAQGAYSNTPAGGTISVADFPGGLPTNTLLLGSALPPITDPTLSGQQTTPHAVADQVLGATALVTVPEPATVSWLAIGGAALLLRRRRDRI